MRQIRPAALVAMWVLLAACFVGGTGSADNAGRGDHKPAAAGAALGFSPSSILDAKLNPLEQGLFDDAADGRLDEHSVLAAALIASGVDDIDQLHRCEAQLAAWVAELSRLKAVSGSPGEQAQAIFEFMHQRILKGGYARDCTDLQRALSEGRFNCVSATVLFNYLAGEFGLTTWGLEIPGHAMSRLVLPDRSLDVETTCPRWFRLLGDPQKQAEMVERTSGLRPLDEASRKRCREVSGVQLAAMIYYNRGVDLLAQQQFPEALAANAKALRLDPASNTARGNLLATLNNWAIAQGSAGRYAEAAERLEQGLKLDPAYETFATNYVHVHYQWVEHLCREGRFAEALAVLDRAGQRCPDQPYLRRAALDVYRRWARARLAADRIEQAFALFAEAAGRYGRSRELREAETAEYNDHALALLEQERFQEAAAFLDRALARQPDAKPLLDNRRVAVMRWAEPAFRSGDYAEAIHRTTYGAAPGRLHEALVHNVRYGYQQWVSELRAAGQRDAAEQITRQAQADPFLSAGDRQHEPQRP